MWPFLKLYYKLGGNVPLFLQDECVLCSPGHYCDTPGLTAPKGECWEGFYCSQGALLPNSSIRDPKGGPCPAGCLDKPCSG